MHTRPPNALDLAAAAETGVVPGFGSLLPWQKAAIVDMMRRRRMGDTRTPEQHADALLKAQAKRDRRASKLLGNRADVIIGGGL